MKAPAVHSFRPALLALPLAALLGMSGPAYAIDTVVLTLENSLFTPKEVRVPAGERFRIEVRNKGAKPAEFESTSLRVEKIVVPGGTVTVNAGPLKPGRYDFFDEYDPDATGTVIAEAK